MIGHSEIVDIKRRTWEILDAHCCIPFEPGGANDSLAMKCGGLDCGGQPLRLTSDGLTVRHLSWEERFLSTGYGLSPFTRGYYC